MQNNKMNNGTQLAKVLWYYNLLPDINCNSQKIVCPFHNDVNPSLIVDLQQGTWFCFGCNRSGDAFKFVQFIEQKNGLNDLKAYQKFLKILKSKKCSNIKIEHTQTKRQKSVQSKELYQVACDYYFGLKTIDWSSDEIDDDIKNACKYMQKRGFKKSTLNKCKAKFNYSSVIYPLIFPMFDNGKFKGWVCRTTDKRIEKKRKYLYNDGFRRATTLVGDYGNKIYVFIVEGYMDRLKFIQFGVDNVVAILGWKMSQEQMQKLKKSGVSVIISALDNDECGIKGTAYLKNYFDVVRFQYPDNVKDPGEMSKQQFDIAFVKTMNIYKRRRKSKKWD